MAGLSVLVVGGGGREHAICIGLSQSESVSEIHCAPGNAGTSKLQQIIISVKLQILYI